MRLDTPQRKGNTFSGEWRHFGQKAVPPLSTVPTFKERNSVVCPEYFFVLIFFRSVEVSRKANRKSPMLSAFEKKNGRHLTKCIEPFKIPVRNVK